MLLYTNLFLLLTLGTLSAAEDVIKCNDTTTHLIGSSGYLLIDRATGSCDIQAQAKSRFFAFKTDNLKLYDGEYMHAMSGNEKQKERNISGPVDSGFFVFGMVEVRIRFILKPNLTGTMMLEFFQDQNSIPINGDKASEVTILSFDADQYNLAFSKNIENSVYLEVTGTSDAFGHHLIDANNLDIPVHVADQTTVVIRAAPVRQDCSKNYADKAEESHEISGPDAASINGKYECVNIFKTDQTGQAHFDVDFANFLDIVDDKDELTIDDGIQALKINRYAARHYNQQKPVLSFRGQNLAIIYDSPQVIKPKAVFKLTVRAQTTGGIVDQHQALSLPGKGLVRYTLRPQSTEDISALEIKGKFTGASLKIYDSHNNVVKFASDVFLPPVIAFNQLGQDITLEFDIKSKVPTTFNYKEGNSCSGVIFESAGAISIRYVANGGARTCYWLIGSNSSLSINHQSLKQPDSCLEIYSIKQEKAIFERCNIGPDEVLPPFILDQGYLAFKTSVNVSTLDASISPAVEGLVKSSTKLQMHYKSTGYPASYPWSAASEKFSLDAMGKKMVLSIVDLDIRAGETMTINSDEISANRTSLYLGDLDVSDKITKVTVTRSLATSDFSIRKGYYLVASQYQAIVSADMNKTSLQTPKNLTSLLLKVNAAQGMRLTYEISNVASKNSNYEMNVFDARSVMGRSVSEEEKYNGSTTSNILLISFITNDAKTTLPEFDVSYKQLACNQTIDHICDQATRCVPADKLCKGKSYCSDGSDLKRACTNGPAPQPQIINTGGLGGLSVFILSVLMFSLGIVAAIYGPDMYKFAENRFRSGQYTTFTSTE